jgi:hypothetical protein
MEVNQFIFIAKVLAVSLIVSVSIKFLGPHLHLSDATGLVLSIVLLPSLLLGLTLGLQLLQKRRERINDNFGR